VFDKVFGFMHKILQFGRLNLRDLLPLYREKFKEIFEVFD
jgi:hypothetical protein